MFRKKRLLKEMKEKLEKEKASIEEALLGFTKKDERPSGDWDTRFPKFNGGDLEEEADEVEEYETLRPIEFSLETRLRDVNLALEKIKKGRYGKCEKCGQDILRERLRVYPAARFCLKCK